jgi:hypothetical protein
MIHTIAKDKKKTVCGIVLDEQLQRNIDYQIAEQRNNGIMNMVDKNSERCPGCECQHMNNL